MMVNMSRRLLRMFDWGGDDRHDAGRWAGAIPWAGVVGLMRLIRFFPILFFPHAVVDTHGEMASNKRVGYA